MSERERKKEQRKIPCEREKEIESVDMRNLKQFCQKDLNHVVSC